MTNKKKKEEIPSDVNSFIIFIVNHPYWLITLSMGLVIICTIVSFTYEFKYDGTNASFYVRSGKTANLFDGFGMSIKDETFYSKENYEMRNSQQLENTQPTWAIIVYYTCEECDNLLEWERLDQIYNFENKIVKDSQYQKFCLKTDDGECDTENSPITPTSFFYDSNGNKVNSLQIGLEDLYNGNNGLTRMGICDLNFDNITYQSKYLRATFRFGSPLENYKNQEDQETEQNDQFNDWIKDLIPDSVDDSNSKDLTIYYLGSGVTEIAVNDLIIHDSLLIIVSIFLVFVYTLFHTKTLTLTILGLFHTIMALPMSYFFYRVLLGIEYFSMLNFLSLFIVLGIGCDDIFIMLDSFRQSKHQKEEISKNIYTRMNWAYKRAATTMLITTLTSAGAFFGNTASTIPPIRYFGVFTGMAIVFNYLLVITYFPAIIVIWNNYGERVCCCFGLFQKKKKKEQFEEDQKDESGGELEDMESSKDSFDSSTTELSSNSMENTKNGKKEKESENQKMGKNKEKKAKKRSKEKETADITQFRRLERYFYCYHSEFILKYRYILLIVFIGIFVGMIIQATKLKPAEDPAEFLPEDHFLSIAISMETDHFYSNDITATIYLVWGVESIDREGIDPLAIDNLGDVIYDKDWNPKLKSSQEYVIQVCDQIQKKWEGEIYRTSQMNCFMKNFRDWVTNETLAGGSYSFPVEEDQFEELLLRYTDWQFKQFRNVLVIQDVFYLPFGIPYTVGFDKKTSELRWFALQFNLILNPISPASKIRPDYEEVEDYIKELNADAPEGIKNLGSVSGTWISMLTEEVLIRVALTSVGVSLAISFLIILIATNNLIISFYALLSISGVVVTIVGMMVSLGWQLGIVESISLTIIVGISVDYIVHFCHAYNVSKKEKRFEKLRESMTSLGISVVSAAVTTLFASFIMFFTYIIFFQRFGIFIWMTILSSVLWSFVFFFVLLAIKGHVNDQGNVKIFFNKIFCKKKYKARLEERKMKKNLQKHAESEDSLSTDYCKDENFIEMNDQNSLVIMGTH
ncbi:sterol-sensing domain [Anaeramoeba flamelloides]|uniref:Sterol-sensing domain n=1 Tax=Anaeramoeba flamelloides TaxID=1746091 RepID=A0AAV8AH77_9EUKA|nr:sterol-sensing domain [Anaeramoeba flamelloides]